MAVRQKTLGDRFLKCTYDILLNLYSRGRKKLVHSSVLEKIEKYLKLMKNPPILPKILSKIWKASA